MIFVTLGSQKFQFNRILSEIDKLIFEGKITEKVFAQIGHSDYIPQFYDYDMFLDREKFAEYIDKANIVITHGGTGVIVNAIKKGKKVIAVPRLEKYGEHVDDHQLQLLSQFNEMDLLYTCLESSEISKALEAVSNKTFKQYKSNTQNIINSIEQFLSEVD